jgi:hypothetical protein
VPLRRKPTDIQLDVLRMFRANPGGILFGDVVDRLRRHIPDESSIPYYYRAMRVLQRRQRRRQAEDDQYDRLHAAQRGRELIVAQLLSQWLHAKPDHSTPPGRKRLWWLPPARGDHLMAKWLPGEVDG